MEEFGGALVGEAGDMAGLSPIYLVSGVDRSTRVGSGVI